MDKPLHVLIVEDSEDDTLLIVRELKHGGYEPAYERVETAGAMRSALGRQAWDVVISDYTMPQFSALAALQVLMESGRDLPFIIVSGTIGEETAVAAMKGGAHDYIMKNNLARLLPAIERELHEADVRRQRKQAERELWESEEKYRILVENANDAIFIDQDEKIKFPNPRTLNLTGYSAEELSRISFLQLIHPDERDMNLEKHRRGDEREKVSGVYSFRVINRAGEELWVQLNAVPIIWEGRPATLNFLRDITKIKELETQFLQAQKMEAIGQLVGGFVHDFNNFLTLIKVCSQLSLMDLKEGDPLREKLEMIHGATERSANLARQLLAFSRRQVMEMKVIDLNNVLRDLDKMLRRVIGEDIELINEFAGDLGRVKADPSQIEQVILNLVINAKDALPQGGKLTIKTGNFDLNGEDARAQLDLTPGAYVMVSVSDTGIGISPKVKDRIFEPFFTTKERGKGTGLGLSAVYGIVKQSGGDICVSSEQGKGTAFKIFLPRADEPLIEEKERGRIKELPHGHETVLVVEDEKEVRQLAVEILKRQGHRVLEAANGGEALLIGEKYKERIHLILADVVMPGMRGHELVKRLSSFHPKMKVLYMSGYVDNVFMTHGLLEGGIDFIQKPFSLEGLVGKVRQVLDK